MSIDSSTRAGAVPAARASEPGSTGALFSPTGEHIGLSPVARAMREPVPTRQKPSTRRLLTLCLVAAVLSFVGLFLGIRGWIGLVMHKTESWFLPAIVLIGVLGVLTAAAGFLTVHRRYVPWVMITLSALILITAMIVTGHGIH